MGLRDVGARLPPGFRFYPNDEELVCHYLHNKIANQDSIKGTLVEVDLHTCEPWQLPEVAKLNSSEWYFFSFRDRKYATGYRTNRATTSGYWKATGKDRVILDLKTKELVGMRKTLVFYQNRAPNGIKTGWIMHEFRSESPHMPPKEDWVLCRVFHKGKGENSNNNNKQCQYMYDYQASSVANTSSSPPPLVAFSPSNTHHTFPCDSQQPNSFSSNHHHTFSQKPMIANNDPIQNNSPLPLNPNNLLDILREGCSNYSINDLINPICAKNNDDYGFLWDMDLEENTKLGDHGAPTLHQHGFGDCAI